MSNADACEVEKVYLQENGIVRDETGLILGRMGMTVERQSIVAAVAQAWCTQENENKVLDPELAEAIVINIVNLF